MSKIFQGIGFIKPDRKINKQFVYSNFAPMFRKKINIEKLCNAKLYVCGLGYGYYYINGKEVTEDKFTAPVSEYTKALWYNVYDVTELLSQGENTFAVWCGNGWYNEEMKTGWNYDEAKWRDVPKFILRLDIDGETVLKSDDSWKCNPDGPIWFNALRSGEYFDSRKYDEDWTLAGYDDSSWENAIADKTPPTGEFRECKCEPVREFEVYNTSEVTKVGDNKYLFDMGQNVSGYIRLKTKGKTHDELTIRYAEEINEDLSLQLNHMDSDEYYMESRFQTDKFICSQKAMTWSPKFAYHGFRYIEIEGITDITNIEVHSVFVHQAVKTASEFECSSTFINRLFRAGQKSVYSNLFYNLTDCPTREKLGWTNDAQSSMEQIFTNFKVEKVMRKWLCDIYDSMDERGALPGIVPTNGWGYEWGNGPVSDGVLYEIPYRIYLHTGDTAPLTESLEYFDRYLAYLKTRTNEEGFVSFGLDDWARPVYDDERDEDVVPAELINALLIRKFNYIAGLAAKLANKPTEQYEEAIDKLTRLIKKTYIDSDGKCKVNKQTAVAMLIYYNVYDDMNPLKEQLKKLVEACDFHHDCGMVGLRRLYMALNKCGLEEYAYKILTSKTFPSQGLWIENGATTLWEYWHCYKHKDSRNHHMYSDFMSWIMKTIVGIKALAPVFERVEINPFFPEDMTWARGICHTYSGDVGMFWERQGKGIHMEITVPSGISAYYNGRLLDEGVTVVNIK